MFSKKATKIDEILTVNLTLLSKRQIGGEDFVNFHGLHTPLIPSEISRENAQAWVSMDFK